MKFTAQSFSAVAGNTHFIGGFLIRDKFLTKAVKDADFGSDPGVY